MNTLHLTTAWCGLASLKRQAMGGGFSSAQGTAPNPSSPGDSLASKLADPSGSAPFIQAWGADGRSVHWLPCEPHNHHILDDGGFDTPRHGGV